MRRIGLHCTVLLDIGLDIKQPHHGDDCQSCAERPKKLNGWKSSCTCHNAPQLVHASKPQLQN